MAYRPYPNIDRALRQLARHAQPVPDSPTLECLRPLADSLAKLRVNAQRAADQGFGLDEYRLSTRGDEHDFQYTEDHVQRCTRCSHPHSQWAGGPCPGVPVAWKSASYV